MRLLSTIVFFLLFLSIARLNAQEHPYDFSVSGSLITSSKLFIHPEDPNEFIRNQHSEFNNLFGFGIDLRRSIESPRFGVGISVEIITKNESSSDKITSSISVPVSDGFTAVPVELTGYFFIPFSNDVVSFYMGGGGGIYFGDRRYEKANVRAETIERRIGYGIHIVTGLEYSLHPNVALRSELKFRNVQFDVVNMFREDFTYYNGYPIALDQQPFASRIAIDGLMLNLGLVVRF